MVITLRGGWAGGDLAEIADVNADGLKDIVAANYNPKNVAVYYGNGSLFGGWPVPETVQVVPHPTSGDLNADGVKEIVYAGTSGVISARHIDGSIMWSNNACQSVGGGILYGPVLADLNGDDQPEILFSCNSLFNPSSIFVLDASGNPYGLWGGVPAHSVVWGTPSSFDFDGDKKRDVVVYGMDAAGMGGYFIQSYHENGSQFWLVHPEEESTQIPPRYESPIISDVDGDGAFEIISTSYNGSTSRIHVFNSAGVAERSWTMNCTSPSNTIVSGAGSGAAIISYCNGTVYSWEADGTLSWSVDVGANAGGTAAEHFPAAGDLNGDGLVETVVPAGNRLVILSSAGNVLVNRTLEDYFGSCFYLTTPSIGNVDGDAKPELVLGAKSGCGPAPGNISTFEVVNRPNLVLFNPKNQTYDSSTIPLDYSAWDSPPGMDSAWYSVDGGVNVSLYGNTTISFENGTHVLFIYANDTLGNVNSTTVTFSINVTQLCNESWSCTDWSTCSGGVQVRVCTDAHDCGTTAGKLPENQTCVIPPPVPPSGGGGGGGSGAYCGDSIVQKWTGEECESNSDCNASYACKACKCVRTCTENWTCSAWSGCASAGGFNNRKCTDTNNCGTGANAPAESRGCATATGGVSVKINPPFLDINAVSEITCGNGNCSEGKNCANCPDDCGACDDAIADSGQGHDLAGLVTGAIQYSLSGLIVTAVIFIFLLSAIWKK
jgi:hypothetical protein